MENGKKTLPTKLAKAFKGFQRLSGDQPVTVSLATFLYNPTTTPTQVPTNLLLRPLMEDIFTLGT